MKVIFLDIDGVLVTSRHFVQSKNYFGHEFDPVCTQYLKQIFRETNAKIVVSSSWREGRTLEQVKAIFKANGIDDCVVGQTPIFEFGTRADEIEMYLSEMRDTEYQVDQFVIIDDDEEMGKLEHHLVRTDFRMGITSDTAKQVAERLR